ncbi:MAG: exo-alpha-sialidase, partial [Oscillospiraceae bacterium]|nr:exo-alpha-sialidase [Oscillospiraceae bacterium]
NLLTQQKSVSMFSEEQFSIIGASANQGAGYELWQEGSKKPIKETTGSSGAFAFMELKPSMFVPGHRVFIRVTTTTGDSFNTQVGLNLLDINPDDPLANKVIDQACDAITTGSRSQDWCFKVPLDWMPEALIDNIDDFVMNLTDSMVLKPELTVSRDFSTKDDKDKDKTRYGSLVCKMDPAKNTLEIGVQGVWGKSFKWGIGTPPPNGGLFTVTISWTAIIDMTIMRVQSIKMSGKPQLYADVKLNPYPIPLQLGATLDLYGTGSFSTEFVYAPTFTYVSSNEVKVTVPKPTVSWSASIGGRAEAGWKVGEALKAIVFGTADFIFKKNEEAIGSYTHPIDEIDFAGKLGVRVKALDFKVGELTLVESKFPMVLWQQSGASSPRPPMYLTGMQTEDGQNAEDAMNDMTVYQSYTADMIPQAGAWNAQFGDGITELQSGISDGSAPVIVTDGTNTVMVWIVKDAARGVENAPYAVWSRYDSSTQTWSEPQPVDDNGNADSAPMLIAGADGIRLAYLESGRIYAEDETPDLNELFGGFVFRTARFDAEAGAFTDFRTAEINAEGGAAFAPKLVQAADGTTYLIWQSNANGNVFGNDSSNRIQYAKETADGWDTPVVLAENLPMITSLTCGQNAAGEPVCAYTCAETSTDGTAEAGLYLTTLSGETVKLAAGQIDAPQFANIPGRDVSGLVWYQDGSLYASADLAAAEVICSSEDCFISGRFAIAGDKILFLSNVSDASALFSTQYDAESGKFTAPVCLESGENIYYESLSLADVGGDVLYAMARTTVESSGDTDRFATSLTGGVLREIEDIRLAEAAYSISGLEAGQTFPIEAQICNDGTVPVSSVTLRILDPTGNEIASDTQRTAIRSGASETVLFEPVLPKLPDAEKYTISVCAAENDRTPENNAAELDFTKTDIALSTDLSYIGDKTLVTIFAENRSLVPAAAVIRIRPEHAEEDTLLLYAEEIAPQSSAYWQLDAKDMLGDIYRDVVFITAETDTEDADPESNETHVLISDSGMDPFTIGDINLDGKVELEDAMLALS